MSFRLRAKLERRASSKLENSGAAQRERSELNTNRASMNSLPGRAGFGLALMFCLMAESSIRPALAFGLSSREQSGQACFCTVWVGHSRALMVDWACSALTWRAMRSSSALVKLMRAVLAGRVAFRISRHSGPAREESSE